MTKKEEQYNSTKYRFPQRATPIKLSGCTCKEKRLDTRYRSYKNNSVTNHYCFICGAAVANKGIKSTMDEEIHYFECVPCYVEFKRGVSK